MAKFNLQLRIISDLEETENFRRFSVIVIRDLDLISGIEASDIDEAIEIARQKLKEQYKKDPMSDPFDRFLDWDFEEMKTDTGNIVITPRDENQHPTTINHTMISTYSAKELYDDIVGEFDFLVDAEKSWEKDVGMIRGYLNESKELYLSYCIR